MDRTDKSTKDYYVVDLAHIARSVWQRIWVVAIVSILVATAGFSLAAFKIAPTYSSSIMLYVNNSTSIGNVDVGFSISSSELSAAQSLAKTYTVILKNRTTLEEVIDRTGVKYTWDELYDMIDSGSVNETEILRVTVTSENPYEAEKIANAIAEVLPERVEYVISGAKMNIVDSAVVDTEKVGPSISTFTVVGFIVGAIMSIVVLIITALMDNTIHDEEYVIKTYGYPILAKVPNLLNNGTKKYGYYYKNYYKKHSTYGGEENGR